MTQITEETGKALLHKLESFEKAFPYMGEKQRIFELAEEERKNKKLINESANKLFRKLNDE